MLKDTHSAYHYASPIVRDLRNDNGVSNAHYAYMAERVRWFLREWRKDRGYSLEKLAEMVGTSKGHLGDIERGNRRYNEDILEALAVALRTTPADIIRRRPTDPEAIEVVGLAPEQVELLESMAAQMRRSG